jgi:hypothetical protein
MLFFSVKKSLFLLLQHLGLVEYDGVSEVMPFLRSEFLKKESYDI